jgi:hypothetical protein
MQADDAIFLLALHDYHDPDLIRLYVAFLRSPSSMFNDTALAYEAMPITL